MYSKIYVCSPAVPPYTVCACVSVDVLLRLLSKSNPFLARKTREQAQEQGGLVSC